MVNCVISIGNIKHFNADRSMYYWKKLLQSQAILWNISFVGSCLAPVNIVNGEIEYYIQQSEGNSRGNRKGSPDNGQVPDGTIAFVSCNEGYIISGRSNHTCLNGLWHLPEVTCTGNKDIAIFISTHKTLVRTISINFSITLLLLSVSHFCYYWCFVSWISFLFCFSLLSSY